MWGRGDVGRVGCGLVGITERSKSVKPRRLYRLRIAASPSSFRRSSCQTLRKKSVLAQQIHPPPSPIATSAVPTSRTPPSPLFPPAAASASPSRWWCMAILVILMGIFIPYLVKIREQDRRSAAPRTSAPSAAPCRSTPGATAAPTRRLPPTRTPGRVHRLHRRRLARPLRPRHQGPAQRRDGLAVAAGADGTGGPGKVRLPQHRRLARPAAVVRAAAAPRPAEQLQRPRPPQLLLLLAVQRRPKTSG